MIKNVYVFDDSLSSRENGIGTFIRELITILKKTNFHVYLLSFNTEIKEFAISKEKGVQKYLFPIINNDFEYQKYDDIISKFMRLYIPDSSDNLFFLNHSPCEKLLRSIKFSHPLSKRIFVIHDLTWTVLLNGRSERLKFIITKEKKDEKEECAYHYFQKEQMMYNFADRVVCLSESTFNILTEIYEISSGRISVIPNGLRKSKLKVWNTNKLRNRLLLQESEKILLYVGRATEQKGFFMLIQAFEKVLKENSYLRLVVVGSFKENALEYISEKHPSIMSKIIITGFLQKKELFKWYAVADIAILPSLYEQCSYVAIEMMMHGLPIIVSDGIGLRDMFQDGENASVAKIGNPKNDYREYRTNLKNCINGLLNSCELMKKISSGAVATYKKRYCSRHMKERYKRLMKELG